MLSTFFKKSDAFTSETFDQFKANRLTIAQRLAGTAPNEEFHDGYGANQQDIIIASLYFVHGAKC